MEWVSVEDRIPIDPHEWDGRSDDIVFFAKNIAEGFTRIFCGYYERVQGCFSYEFDLWNVNLIKPEKNGCGYEMWSVPLDEKKWEVTHWAWINGPESDK